MQTANLHIAVEWSVLAEPDPLKEPDPEPSLSEMDLFHSLPELAYPTISEMDPDPFLSELDIGSHIIRDGSGSNSDNLGSVSSSDNEGSRSISDNVGYASSGNEWNRSISDNEGSGSDFFFKDPDPQALIIPLRYAGLQFAF